MRFANKRIANVLTYYRRILTDTKKMVTINYYVLRLLLTLPGNPGGLTGMVSWRVDRYGVLEG